MAQAVPVPATGGGLASSPASGSDTTSTNAGSVMSISSSDDGTIGNYKKLEDLGVGGYSRVILASHTTNNQLAAIKILLSEPKQIVEPTTKQILRIEWSIGDSKLKQCRRELELMKAIAHDNVVKLLGTIEDATFPQKDEKTNNMVDTPCLCVVLEYCSRGELFDYLMYAGGLGSRVTRTYFHQFLNGLEAMHNAGYVHRDLKPENLLLDDNYNLKIADFGFATPFKDLNGDIQLTTTCGTRGYLAPELIRGEKYTNKVDLFAVGIIMFTTFAGFPPFQHAGRGDWWWDKMEKAWNYWAQATAIPEDSDANKERKKERIGKGNQKMKLFWSAHERTCRFSDTFKHLMQYLLNPTPAIRYGIEQCRQHAWLRGKTLNQRNLRRQMKKLYEKVTKQRAAKIAEQLKQRNMVPQKTDGKEVQRTGWEKEPPKGRFVKLADEWLPTLKNNKDEGTLVEQVAILKLARFQFATKISLAKILETIDKVALKYQAVPKQDSKKFEYDIIGRITHIKPNNQHYEEAEKVIVKVKMIYEKNILTKLAEEESDDDPNDEYVAGDSDEEEDNKEDNDNNNGTNLTTTTSTTSNNGDGNRWIVVFWRAQGSQQGFQTLMSQIFYDPLMNSLLDTTELEELNVDELNSIVNTQLRKPVIAIDNALNVTYDFESDALPDMLPNV